MNGKCVWEKNLDRLSEEKLDRLSEENVYLQYTFRIQFFVLNIFY